MAAVLHLLGHRQAQIVAIEARHRVDIGDEEAHRPVPHDLERPREQHAVDVVLLLGELGRAHPFLDRDAFGGGLHHLGELRLVRQLRRLGVAHAVHVARLGVAVPADLLDAVVELVDVAFRIRRIEMPVRAGQVAAGAADRLAALGEPAEGVGDLAQRADLPGDLVDRALRLLRPFVQRRKGAAREEDERMMVGAVAREVADRRPDFRAQLLGQARGEIERIRQAKAEQAAIEILAALRVADVDAEVAEAADAEGARQAHAPDVEETVHASTINGVRSILQDGRTNCLRVPEC